MTISQSERLVALVLSNRSAPSWALVRMCKCTCCPLNPAVTCMAAYRFAQANSVAHLFLSVLMDSHDRRRQRDYRSRGHVPPWTGPRSAGRVSVLLVITDSDKSRDKYRASGVQVAEPYPGRATVHRL